MEQKEGRHLNEVRQGCGNGYAFCGHGGHQRGRGGGHQGGHGEAAEDMEEIREEAIGETVEVPVVVPKEAIHTLHSL